MPAPIPAGHDDAGLMCIRSPADGGVERDENVVERRCDGDPRTRDPLATPERPFGILDEFGLEFLPPSRVP
jgi:hypothetical protein